MIIDSFCGPEAEGNRHQIIAFKQATVSARFKRLEHLPTPIVDTQGNSITLWQQGQFYYARFFTRGQSVRRCGSGNIALAAYLYSRQYQRPFTVPLHTDAGTLVIGVDQRGAFYGDQPCAITGEDDPARWAQLCQTAVVKAVRMGGRQDYILLLLPDVAALLQLKLRSDALKRYSERAVIALAAAQQHWQLRYFAPQYAESEDAATGSACVQASAYLANTSPQRLFRFVQRSRAGGIIHTEYQAHQVTVRGDYQLHG